jgi:hypothetical protein
VGLTASSLASTAPSPVSTSSKEGLLISVELLGAAPEASALQLLDDGVKIGDPRLRPLVDRRKPNDLGFEHRLLGF